MEANENVAAEPAQEELDRGFELAMALTDGLLTTVDAVCALPTEGADFAAVIYGTWTNLTRELVMLGWSSEQIAKDAKSCAEDQEAEDAADKIGDTAGSA